jgi:acyl-CoA thioesterase
MDPDDYGQFPLRQFLGMEMDSTEPGEATARLEVTDSVLNPNGVVHGGVLFTMVDTAMGKATMTVLEDGQLCASIELQMRFLRPVATGSLRAHAAVIRRGRRIIHLDSQVWDGAGVLVATGAGTFAVIG